MKQSAAISALAALAQPARLEVFRMLVQEGSPGLPAGEIARRLKMPAPTLSFHLAHLRRAGLLRARRHSRSICYAANYSAMTALLAYLTENCCQGRPESCLPAPVATAPVAMVANGSTGCCG